MVKNSDFEKQRKVALSYFFGNIAPIIMMFVGLLTCPIIIGFIIFPIGLIWFTIDKYSTNSKSESIIDELITLEMNEMKLRAYEKLNVIEEQVDIIDPICLIGPSRDLPDSEKGAVGMLNKLVIAFDFFIDLFRTVIIRLSESHDVIDKAKLGADNNWRYSLVEYSVFVFDKSQLFIYYAHLDITTGMIFHEGTYEYFYRDIVGVSTKQQKVKIFLPKKIMSLKKRRFTYRLYESIKISTSGCSHTASINSDIDRSVVDMQFLAMRNLIRDKKEREHIHS